MPAISLPTEIRLEHEKEKNRARLVVEPCFPGYGVTLGNSFRRVLLSSLPGAAVTAVKFKGVTHEFSTLPHVKEDIIEILLHIKQIRLKLFRQEPVQITLHVEGERNVHAKDITPSADVEVMNGNLLIATLTDKAAVFDMELTVEPGYGYVPIEARDKKPSDIGLIAVDAIFTPIRNIGFQIEPVRVGQMTNYERLLLNIETDGTITPEEAIQQSATLLLDHIQLFKSFSKGEATTPELKEKQEEKAEEEVAAPTEPSDTSEKAETSETQEGEAPKKRGRPKKVKTA